MNIEPDIFDYLQTTSLEPHDDYTSEITYKDQKTIWNRLQEQEKEIEELKAKLEMYENGVYFSSENDELQEEIEKLNNIIKEVREYIETKYDYLLGDDTFLDHDELVDSKQIKHILEILDKGE